MPPLEFADVPEPLLARVRIPCSRLPDASEERTMRSSRWRVRRRTFAELFNVDRGTGPVTVMIFRSAEPELGVLLQTGHPFFPGPWGSNVVGMVLDDDTDWEEVAELVTESYCVMAPKKLVAQVDRPG